MNYKIVCDNQLVGSLLYKYFSDNTIILHRSFKDEKIISLDIDYDSKDQLTNKIKIIYNYMTNKSFFKENIVKTGDTTKLNFIIGRGRLKNDFFTFNIDGEIYNKLESNNIFLKTLCEVVKEITGQNIEITQTEIFNDEKDEKEYYRYSANYERLKPEKEPLETVKSISNSTD